jgi:hypothetical protein
MATMTPELLSECGAALYGGRWQSELARDLNVNDRTVRRWLAGRNPMPPGVALELLRLLRERAADIDNLIHRMRAAAPR